MEKYAKEYQTALKQALLDGKLLCATKVDYLRTVRTLIGQDAAKELSTLFQTVANTENAGFLTNLLIFISDKQLQQREEFAISNTQLGTLRDAFNTVKMSAISIEPEGWTLMTIADEQIACRLINESMSLSGIGDKKWLSLPEPVSFSECGLNFQNRETKTGYQFKWTDANGTEHNVNLSQ